MALANSKEADDTALMFPLVRVFTVYYINFQGVESVESLKIEFPDQLYNIAS